MANSFQKGREKAKKDKKKLGQKIGMGLGYASEVAKTISNYGTPAGIALTVASKIKQKFKDRGKPKGPFKRISTEPTPEQRKRFEDSEKIRRPNKSLFMGDTKGSIRPNVRKKMGGGMMKQPMGYTDGGMCRGMGAAVKGGKFEGVK